MRWIGKILFAVLISFSTNSYAQIQLPSLISPSKEWEINLRSTIGAKTRIKATHQDPLPFCFATAATMLWDQHRCTIDKKNCFDQTPSSFLATVAAGQRFSLGSEIDMRNGGSPYLSLNHIVKNGFVEYKNCNYSEDLKDKKHQLYQLDSFRQQWLKYRDYTPYLERFYKKEFIKTVQNFNPEITELEAEIILNMPLSETELSSVLLIRPGCWKNSIKDNRFVIKYFDVKVNLNAKKTFGIINKLLDEKKPVLINFCSKTTKNLPCGHSDYHSAIIIARSIAINNITKDKRTVYWIVNSWGEGWQAENRDGWVFADNLLEEINGELIWLDLK